MALSTKELNTLLSLLSEETLRSSTLEQLAVIFNRNFTKADHFRVGMALTVLLQEKDLLPQTMQRIAALYLVYEMHRTEPLPSNPLAPFLAELIQPTLEDGLPPVSYPNYILNSIEKTFLLQLATSPQSRELIKRSPLQIASVDPGSIPPPDTSTLLALLQGSLSKVSQADMTGKNCILKDPDITATTHHDPTSAGQTAEDLLCGADVPSLEVFEPGLVRPAPPLHVSTNEATWLNPTDGQYDIQWDYNMCQSNTADSDVVKLMTKACSDVLPVTQQESLAKQIQSEPNIVYHSGLVPSKLPSLVENNPLIAYEALLQLMSSNQISEYLQTLVNMDMSLHSMEVVNRLTTAVDLPSEFIHLYITNCIQTCHNTKDKFMKSRLVRLVCVFLQSLIRNKIIRVEEHSTEIQQFCLEFSQIREATALFKLLKNMENPEAAKQL